MYNKSKIVTFYSYKGGVGRSMALANVAWTLAKKYKVIAIDWDLEAPGLHRYLNIPQENIKNGLIDIFYDYKDLLRKDEIPTNGELIDIEKYLEKVPENLTTGSISLLAAGRFDEDYATKVNNFDWEDFYDNWHGYGFIEYLKERLKEKADFILVDSRTGITDIGGICTIQVPDVVVLLFALNEQNIYGIETICEKIRKSVKLTEKESPKLILIPARVEKYLENNLLNDWAETASKHLGKYLFNRQKNETSLEYMEKNLIPYSGFYSFGEKIVDKNDFNKDLPESYENLMNLILKELGYDIEGKGKDKFTKLHTRDKSGSDTQEFKNVLALAEKLAKEKPEDYDLLILKGFALYESKKYEEALKAFEKAIKINPDDEIAWYNIGNTLRDLGMKEEALKAYKRAIEIKQDYLESWSSMGSVLKDLDRKEEALKACEIAIEINSDDETAWYNKGNILKDLNRKEEALNAYKRAIEVNQDYLESWSNMGSVLKDLDRKEEALKAYEKAIKINPDDETAWYNKGNILKNLNRKEEALKAYERAIEINPDNEMVWYYNGNILRDLNRKKDALKAFEKATEINPDNATVLVGMGTALNDFGRNEEALKTFEKAVEVQPCCLMAWCNMGNILHVLGKKEDALKAFEKAIKINPDFEIAWIGMGTTLNDFGRNEEALKAYKRAIEIEPNRVMTLINMGHTFRSLGKNEEALNVYERAIEIDPFDEKAWASMGSVLSNLGNNEEALKAFEKALEIKPDYADAWYNLACINARILNKKKALCSLKRAIELNEQFRNVAAKDTDLVELRNEYPFEFKTLTDKPKSLISNLDVTYRGSIFGDRINHFFYEKKAIATKMISILEKELTINNKMKICLLIDSGTTTYHLFTEICDRIKKSTNLTEETNSWVDRIFIVTNNLPGIQYLTKYCRKEPSEYSDLLVKCFLLPGKPLPVYAAVAGSETVDFLNEIGVKKLIESELNAQPGEYQIICLMSANYIVRHPEKINGKILFCPVARGGEKGGHYEIKRAFAKLSDKIYIVSPLTKFSFATCECLNGITGLTISEEETPELAKVYPEKIKYREIELTTPGLIEKCNFVLTDRNSTDIFGEFAHDIHEILKLSYGESKIYIADYNVEERIPNGKVNPEYDNIVMEIEIPHENLRNSYNLNKNIDNTFIWARNWMIKDEECRKGALFGSAL